MLAVILFNNYLGERRNIEFQQKKEMENVKHKNFYEEWNKLDYIQKYSENVLKDPIVTNLLDALQSGNIEKRSITYIHSNAVFNNLIKEI